jgi:ankyrin repeat protein
LTDFVAHQIIKHVADHCSCLVSVLTVQVKLLVGVGGADPTLKDRWEQTPLDEARKAGAQPVVQYLLERLPGEMHALPIALHACLLST